MVYLHHVDGYRGQANNRPDESPGQILAPHYHRYDKSHDCRQQHRIVMLENARYVASKIRGDAVIPAYAFQAPQPDSQHGDPDQRPDMPGFVYRVYCQEIENNYIPERT